MLFRRRLKNRFNFFNMIHLYISIYLYICHFLFFFLKKKNPILCLKRRTATKLNATLNGKMNKYLDRKTKTKTKTNQQNWEHLISYQDPFWFKTKTYQDLCRKFLIRDFLHIFLYFLTIPLHSLFKNVEMFEILWTFPRFWMNYFEEK